MDIELLFCCMDLHIMAVSLIIQNMKHSRHRIANYNLEAIRHSYSPHFLEKMPYQLK